MTQDQGAQAAREATVPPPRPPIPGPPLTPADRKHPAYRPCPIHVKDQRPMLYRGSGVTWNHIWQCRTNMACTWGAMSLTGPMVTSYPGAPAGDGYLTWEQWQAQQPGEA